MEYFYNDFINMYCIIGTTYSAESLRELESVVDINNLIRVDMPDYITEDYDALTW